MKSISKILLFLLPALALFSSCSDNKSSNNVPDNMFGTFATLVAVSSDGASFQIQEAGVYTSPVLVVASWSGQKPENYKVGSRYYIYYTNGTADKPFMGGQISLYAIAACENGEAVRKPLNEISPLAYGTYMCNYTPTVTGQYLNVFLTAGTNASGFGLYIDEETIDSEYPDAYIGLDSRSTITGGTDYFGSFSFEDVWSTPGLKGLNVHYELGGSPAVLKIEKNTISPIN